MMWDTVVVGAGIEGSAAAYDLAERGRKTLLIEQVRSLPYYQIRPSTHNYQTSFALFVG